jgi:hypothetical protein
LVHCRSDIGMAHEPLLHTNNCLRPWSWLMAIPRR